MAAPLPDQDPAHDRCDRLRTHSEVRKDLSVSIAGQQTATVATYETDRELLSLVLRPYKMHCRYLKTADLEAAQDPGPTVAGNFEIDESCYIDDTGHFNSVEFNICYNQLAYYLIAKSVQEGLLPAFRVQHGGGGQRESGVDLGYGGPDGGAVLAVSVAEVFGCLRCELFGAAEMFWSCHGVSTCMRVLEYYRAGRRICGSPASG